VIGLQSYIVEEGISPGWGCLFVWKREEDKKNLRTNPEVKILGSARRIASPG
jgi:hypothetical protein